MVPPYKLVKLDNRHNYCTLFQYMVEFNGLSFDGGIVLYADLIAWCNDQWGLSIDVDDLVSMKAAPHYQIIPSDWKHPFSNDWAYSGRFKQKRVYLTAIAADWFQLASPIG